ncbi:MAG TPA: hypothetical protein VIX59_20520 [Candidatus Binataceae bacterium]
MRTFLFTSVMITVLAGLAFAADIDRHADYSDPSAGANAPMQCKTFSRIDDTRTACHDFCDNWKKDHQGATCACGEDKCPAEQGQPIKP